MAIGNFAAYSMVVISGTNLTAETDLGRGYSKVIFDIAGATEPCMFYAAPAAGGTYKLIRYNVLSGLSAPQTVTVGTACSGSLVEITQLQGYRFIKVATSGTIANGGNVRLYCADV